ncbi:MAG: hypothetical protein ABI472_08710 [Ginsengibacter sp.]
MRKRNCQGLFMALMTLDVFHVDARAIDYPYPVQYFSLNIDGQPVQMAYMGGEAAKSKWEIGDTF